MPFYDVQHTLSLSEKQKEKLADAITPVHTLLFTAPKLFVNVAFTDVSNREIFAAGKRVSCPVLDVLGLISVHEYLSPVQSSRPQCDTNSLALSAFLNFEIPKTFLANLEDCLLSQYISGDQS